MTTDKPVGGEGRADAFIEEAARALGFLSDRHGFNPPVTEFNKRAAIVTVAFTKGCVAAAARARRPRATTLRGGNELGAGAPMRETGALHNRWPILAIVCVLASLLVPGIASASTAAGPETRVWAFELHDQVGVRIERSLTLELHQGCEPRPTRVRFPPCRRGGSEDS